MACNEVEGMVEGSASPSWRKGRDGREKNKDGTIQQGGV
jgi:hypothetical protein